MLYFNSPIWWCGILMIVYGEVGNLTALLLAPAPLVAPLGLTTWIANAIIFSLNLKETVIYKDTLGTVSLMVAAFLLVNIPTKTDHILEANSIKECGQLWFFIFYLLLVIAVRVLLDRLSRKDKSDNQQIVVLLVQTTILGSFTVVYTKAVSSMLVSTLKGENQLKYPIFYFMLAVMVISAYCLIRSLNATMKIDDNNPSYSTSHVVRINFVLFTAAAIVLRFYGSIPLIRFLFLSGVLLSFICIYFIAGGHNKLNTPPSTTSKERKEHQIATSFNPDVIPSPRGTTSALEPIQLENTTDNERTLDSETIKTELGNGETFTKNISSTSVFNYILNNGVNGALTLDNLLFKFENDEEMALNWFRGHSKSFRIIHDATTMKQAIHLCLENVLPCYNYWTEIGCNVSCCKMFHICKKFLHGIPHSEISCKYNHNVDELVKSELASEHNLRSLSSDHLLLLLKSRLPFVCKNSLAGKCDSLDGICPNIHICGDFIAGKCKKADGLCSYKHESALETKHSVDVRHSYHISREDYLKCIIYLEEETKSIVKSPQIFQNFNSLKEEAICYRYINDDCMEGSSCKLRHPDPRLPFLWQYRDETEAWKDFSTTISTEIEIFFCFPNNGNYFSLSSEALTVDFPGNVAPWKGIYHNNQVDIRRLSTMSSVHAKDESAVGLTQWKWYCDFENVWDEYNVTVVSRQLRANNYRKWTIKSRGVLRNNGQIQSDDIEKAFLDGQCKVFKFQIKENGYLLNFETMEQQNSGPMYFTKRKVTRRPNFQDLEDIWKSKEEYQPPTNWPKIFEDGTRISISDKNVAKEIQEVFLKSINEKVDILAVKEICNDTHYRKYINSRNEFIKRLEESNIKEMFLYHGTSATSVEGICKQNFDWRLNGMQGVVYGKGSYFARDASYSNTYSKPEKNGHQYMFVAQVLVGKYTMGNSSMSRPPEDTSSGSHRLYDSCVNNVSDPSIYVIFERDQVYPRYLITYQKEDKNSVEFIPSSMNDIKVDMKVKTSYGIGTIKWLNPSPPKLSRRTNIGIQFQVAVGYTDGFHAGDETHHFICQRNHGAYVKFSDLLCAYK